jgi:hypothetical protein
MILLPLLNMILRIENPGKAILALASVPILLFLAKTWRALGFKTRVANLVPEEK